MMKKRFETMNAQITPGEELAGKVMETVSATKTVKTRRPLMAVAAVLAIILLVTPVMASNGARIAELMYNVSPEMAARFTPVGQSVEKHGIRMEVVSASFHGATAEICVSFEDLEGDRVNEYFRMESRNWFQGIDLFSWQGSRGLSVHSENYDAETGKYMAVIEANYSHYSNLLGRYKTVNELFNGKITLCVDSIRWKNPDGSKETLDGPWMIGVAIRESDYVGERDDGVPLVTSPPQ